jgi:magnesium chelatase family protein
LSDRTGAQELLKAAITRLGLSARAYDRVLKLSRTMRTWRAWRRGHPHVAEAVQYRSLDRQL